MIMVSMVRYDVITSSCGLEMVIVSLVSYDVIPASCGPEMIIVSLVRYDVIPASSPTQRPLGCGQNLKTANYAGLF